jgi:hypothetical protein
MKLSMNRWQGAWVVLTLLWLAAIVFIGRSVFPTEALQEEKARMDVRAARAPYMPGSHVDCFPPNPSDRASCPREKAPLLPLSMEHFRLMEEHAVRHARENSTAVQASFVGEAVACWIIPAVVLYLLGLGCAWVGRSTRKA